MSPAVILSRPNEVLMALLDGRRLFRPKALGRNLVRNSVLVRNSRPVRPWNPASSRLRKIATLPCLLILLLALVAVCGWPVRAFAQADVNELPIQPREAEGNKTEEVATQSLVSPSLNTHVRPLKVDVDLVLVPVTITDPMNRLVTGLEKDNFLLTDNGKPQEIRHFSSEDAPISLGVIFDVSGSMADKIDKSRQAVVEFFRTANPQDEFFLLTFS